MSIPSSIRTPRLEIRPFHEDDFERYLAFMTDPDATRHLLLEHEHRTESGARDLFDLVRDSYETHDPVWALAIVTDEDGYVGSCGVAPVDGTAWECYYTLLPAYRGRGFASEATRALIDHVFETMPVTEMRAYVSPGNPRAAAVAEQIGMERVGMQIHPGFGEKALLFRVTRNQWTPHAGSIA